MSSIVQSIGDSWVLWTASALSLVAAVVYFIIAAPTKPEGYKAPPTPVVVIAGLAYFIGGGLILLADRRLLTVGAIINPLVLVAYTVAAIKGHATVDGLSLTSKAAQVGLEVLLLWLIVQPVSSPVEIG
jgi:hypothetical protein